jgi:hypothetical protein
MPPTPAWLLDSPDCQSMFCACDFGPEPIPLSFTNYTIPLGACFAIRAKEQRRFRYDPSLGHAPGRSRGCEETDVIEAMLKENHSGWWVPEAEVIHIIPPSRQTLGNIILEQEGLGEGWMHTMRLKMCGFFFGVPLKIWLKFPLSYVRFRLAYLFGLKSWRYYLMKVAWYHGVLKYCLNAQPIESWLPEVNLKD